MLLRKLRILIILLWLFISFFSPFAHAQTTKNLSITATVAAQESDYYTLLEQTTSGSQFSQDSTINYKITYGTHINSLQSFTLQASWSRGSFADPGVPAVDVLDYVTGTATKAYNQTSPIIDLVNRTISWTIADFPANSSNQTVTFSLKTTGQYTGSSRAPTIL